MPAPFAAHAADTITIGSASKMFWGGLCVGWIRAPRHLVDRIVATRVHLDLGSSLFDQLVVAELIQRSDILPTRRQILRYQRDTLSTALHTPPLMALPPPTRRPSTVGPDAVRQRDPPRQRPRDIGRLRRARAGVHRRGRRRHLAAHPLHQARGPAQRGE